jgi:LytS/YehU family sensor histidine kinase
MEATERRAASETALIQAELDTLKNQMKPHFLFNALNNIAAMAHDHDAETVPMLNKVASLYRLILASSRSVTQTLTAELEVVRHYLDLEGLRLRSRLSYRIDAGGVDGATPVPCLLLQTLVENCVKHGIAPSLAGGVIQLKLSGGAAGGVDVVILNTGEPLRPGFAPGTGLTNSIRRLELLYPGRHGFNLATDAEGSTVVRFWLGPRSSFEEA